MIEADFLAILACPVCEDRPPLRQEGEYLICTKAGHGYVVKNGIPRLLPEDAIAPEKMKELHLER